MKTKKLHKLKEFYTPFAREWIRWVRNRSCSLNNFERYAMEARIRNNFEIVHGEEIMSNYRSDVTKRINFKLLDKSQILISSVFLVENPSFHYEQEWLKNI